MFPFSYTWWTPILLPLIASGQHRKIFPYDLDGPFKQTLMSLFRLAWSSKVQLPLLITVVFMTFDIQLQVEINIIWEGRREPEPEPLPEQEGEEIRIRRHLIRQIHALAPLAAPEEDSDTDDDDDEDEETSSSSSSSDEEDDDYTSSDSYVGLTMNSIKYRKKEDREDDDDKTQPRAPQSCATSNANQGRESQTGGDASNEKSTQEGQDKEGNPDTSKDCDDSDIPETVAAERVFIEESASSSRISYVPLWNVLKGVLEFQKRVTCASQIHDLPKCSIAQRLVTTDWYKNIDLAPR